MEPGWGLSQACYQQISVRSGPCARSRFSRPVRTIKVATTCRDATATSRWLLSGLKLASYWKFGFVMEKTSWDESPRSGLGEVHVNALRKKLAYGFT